MPQPTPEEIHIRRRALTVLRQLLRAAQPQEGCALLLGDRGGAPATSPPRREPAAGGAEGEPAAGLSGAGRVVPVLVIRLIWPCLNIWEPAAERNRRFLLDPREQLLAQRWGRARGLQVLGAAHSHPCSVAVPSATDLELAVAPTLQLILSPLQDWAPACWWLELNPDGRPKPRPLRWRMVD